jgi:uncharacterized protein YbjQ (UPF0145 family)
LLRLVGRFAVFGPCIASLPQQIYAASVYGDIQRAAGKGDANMVTTTTNDIDGYAVTQYLGVVRGIVVRSPNIAQGFIGGINQIFGGNISAYADVCETARAEAYELMRQHAKAMGADGIIAVRYDATEFMQGATEVLCYGTAVRLAPRSAS